jgi:hypothetical protein
MTGQLPVSFSVRRDCPTALSLSLVFILSLHGVSLVSLRPVLKSEKRKAQRAAAEPHISAKSSEAKKLTEKQISIEFLELDPIPAFGVTAEYHLVPFLLTLHHHIEL